MLCWYSGITGDLHNSNKCLNNFRYVTNFLIIHINYLNYPNYLLLVHIHNT
jgi:hypothetical protein